MSDPRKWLGWYRPKGSDQWHVFAGPRSACRRYWCPERFIKSLLPDFVPQPLCRACYSMRFPHARGVTRQLVMLDVEEVAHA
jgi:hypothetical protein